MRRIVLLAGLFWSSHALAATASQTAQVPPGSGLSGVSLQIEPEKQQIRFGGCAHLPCELTESLSFSDIGAVENSEALVVSVGSGAAKKRIVRVIVRAKGQTDRSWEAIVVPTKTAAAVIWSGFTGFGSQDESHRVVVMGDDLVIGEIDRQRTLCGQTETLLNPVRVHPESLTLHSVLFSRITQAARDAAEVIDAKISTNSSIGSVLGLRGASNNEGAAPRIVDADAKTAWFENTPGDGFGEFVLLTVPPWPLQRLSLVVRPLDAPADYAAPSSLWVSTDSSTFYVNLPQDLAAGQRVDVTFPSPLSSSCLAISLNETKSNFADPKVGIAEVEGVPVLPAEVHSLHDVAAALNSESTSSIAARLLIGAGSAGALTLGEDLDLLSPIGQSRAASALGSMPCQAASKAFATLITSKNEEVAGLAKQGLDSCGKGAANALEDAFMNGGHAQQMLLAGRFAKASPDHAFAAFVSAFAYASVPLQHTMASALKNIAGVKATIDAAQRWVASWKPDANDVETRLFVARSLVVDPAARKEMTSGALKPLRDLFLQMDAENESFEHRYFAIDSLGKLASDGDSSAIDKLRIDLACPNRYLRIRVVQSIASIASLRSELETAVDDADPRVRETAILALSVGPNPSSTQRILPHAKDNWSYVRHAVLSYFASLQALDPAGVDVLVKALEDPIFDIRVSAVNALAAKREPRGLARITEIAFDNGEDRDMRVIAISALASYCETTVIDRLYKIVVAETNEEGATGLALASIEALGVLRPTDLNSKLSSINTTATVVADAVRHSLGQTACAGH